MKIMKYLNKIATALGSAALAMLLLTGCEGADIYSVNAPDWISQKVDSIAAEKAASIVTLTPTPEVLGAEDNTQDWWSAFTDDIKLEQGKTYQIPLTNYGGASNWNNFVIILRNATKDYEYAILRADNWGWGTGYTGEESDAHFNKSTEDGRDWATWAKAMSRSQCMINLVPNGSTVDIKITMVGADGVTYTQNYLNIDNNINPDDLYLSFTVDHSHIVFGTPVDVPDSNPASMELKNVPKKVLIGTTFEAAMANISATVTFEDGMKKDVTAEELTLQHIPDMSTTGKKTLIAVYNKTYKGESSVDPIVATTQFEVVDKMFTSIGATDNSSPFAAEHSEAIKVGAGETFVTTFTNYTDGAANWNNFLVELFNADKTKFYATLRADNFGWGDGYAAATTSGGQADWATWLAAMDGAKVTVYVSNNGDGTADVKAIMVGNDGKTYTQEYNGINNIDPDNMYFHLTIEKAHLEFDTVVGAEDNTSAFAAEHSAAIMVPSGKTYVTRFTNYTDGATNWNNFLVELFNADKTKFYATLRADNYGWGDGYAAATTSGGQADWATWLAAMDEAKVTVYVSNNGDGTADVKAVMIGNDGKTYTQEYNGINNIDPANMYFHLTIEKAHLVFE